MTFPTLAVITVSLEDRFQLLAEAVASVTAQTLQPDDHLIGIDWSRIGEVRNNNRLIAATDCEWLGFLHDDDLWTPDHLANAAKYMADYDVIVSRVTTVGRPQSTLERQHDSFEDLRFTNWFPPSAVVVRRSVFGEWSTPDNPPPQDWVDWSNWRRLLDVGARFVHTNAPTCLYRFGPWSNGSWHG